MSYIGHHDVSFEQVTDHWGESAICWCWGCPWGSCLAASQAKHCRGTHVCISATISHNNMVNYHTHQRLVHLWPKTCVFLSVFLFLYYSYMAKIHFCTEEFNFLDSPQSRPVAPHECFFFKCSGCIQIRDLMEIIILPSNMTGVQDSTGIWAFKVKLPDHNFEILLLVDFRCSYIRQSLDWGHVWWKHPNLRWIPHRTISARFENKTM